MDIAICVPWRGGDPSREFLWKMVRPHYEAMPWPIFEGDSDADQPFNRSQARNRAVDNAGPRDVYAFVDADTVIGEAALAEACRLAYECSGAAYAYDRFLEVDPTDTSKGGRERTTLVAGPPNSGNVCISAPAFEGVGGWDERASEWGWEDGAMSQLLAATTLVWHVPGTIVTFDHSRLAEETPEKLIADGLVRPAWLDGYGDKEATIRTIRALRVSTRSSNLVRG